jgi:citrate lyase subunit beta/citryl-CoA lyase
MDDDLAAVVGPHVAGISVGKVSTPEDVRHIADSVGRLEIKAGASFGSIKLILWLETAGAIVNAHSICSASNRVVAVAFGGEDYTNDMAIERSESETEVAFPRGVVVVAARAAGVLALDTPYFKFKDSAGLTQSSIASRGLGFRGRFAIHPSQIDAINAAYMPSEEEIEEARRVVATFEEAETQGSGATSLDGKVIDVPVVERARKVLAVARLGDR